MIRSVEVLTPIEVYLCDDIMGKHSATQALNLCIQGTQGHTAMLPVGVYELGAYEDIRSTTWYLMKNTAWGCWDATWESYEQAGECKLVYSEEAAEYKAVNIHRDTQLWENTNGIADPTHPNNSSIIPNNSFTSVAVIRPGTYNLCVVDNADDPEDPWLMIEGTHWGAYLATWLAYILTDNPSCELIRGTPDKSKSKHIPLGDYLWYHHSRYEYEELSGSRIAKIEYSPEKHALVEYVYMGEVLLSDNVIEYLNSKPILAGDDGLLIGEE